jgi:hypothetical protein
MTAECDVLSRDTTIIDGICQREFRGTVGIRGEKTTAVRDLIGAALRVVAGSGLVLSAVWWSRIPTPTRAPSGTLSPSCSHAGRDDVDRRETASVST